MGEVTNTEAAVLNTRTMAQRECNMRWSLLMVHVFLVFVAKAQEVGLPSSPGGPAELTTSGQGQVEVTPDIATVTVGVTAVRSDPDDALSEVAIQTQSILDVLNTNFTISSDNIQTSQVSIFPIVAQTVPSPLNAGTSQITGYRASVSIDVKVDDLSILGEVLDEVVAAGANIVGNIAFGISNETEVEDEARKLAILDANRVAKNLAESAGATEYTLTIDEINDSGTFTPFAALASPSFYDEGSSNPVPISPGTITVTSNVNMKYSLRIISESD